MYNKYEPNKKPFVPKAPFKDKPYIPQRTVDSGCINGLMAVVQEGNFNKIHEYVTDKNMTFNTTTANGETVLHMILKNEDMNLSDDKILDMVKFFVQNGTSASAQDGGNVTALHLAAKRQLSDVVQNLIDIGVEPNAVTNMDMNALHYAVRLEGGQCKVDKKVGSMIPLSKEAVKEHRDNLKEVGVSVVDVMKADDVNKVVMHMKKLVTDTINRKYNEGTTDHDKLVKSVDATTTDASKKSIVDEVVLLYKSAADESGEPTGLPTDAITEDLTTYQDVYKIGKELKTFADDIQNTTTKPVNYLDDVAKIADSVVTSYIKAVVRTAVDKRTKKEFTDHEKLMQDQYKKGSRQVATSNTFALDFNSLLDEIVGKFVDSSVDAKDDKEYNQLRLTTQIMKTDVNPSKPDQQVIESRDYNTTKEITENRCYTFNKGTIDALIKGRVNVNQKDSAGNTPLVYAIDTLYPGLVKELLKSGNIDVFSRSVRNKAGVTPLEHAINAYKSHTGKDDLRNIYEDAHNSIKQTIFNNPKYKNNIIKYADNIFPQMLMMYNEVFNKLMNSGKYKWSDTQNKRLDDVLSGNGVFKAGEMETRDVPLLRGLDVQAGGGLFDFFKRGKGVELGVLSAKINEMGAAKIDSDVIEANLKDRAKTLGVRVSGKKLVEYGKTLYDEQVSDVYNSVWDKVINYDDDNKSNPRARDYDIYNDLWVDYLGSDRIINRTNIHLAVSALQKKIVGQLDVDKPEDLAGYGNQLSVVNDLYHQVFQPAIRDYRELDNSYGLRENMMLKKVVDIIIHVVKTVICTSMSFAVVKTATKYLTVLPAGELPDVQSGGGINYGKMANEYKRMYLEVKGRLGGMVGGGETDINGKSRGEHADPRTPKPGVTTQTSSLNPSATEFTPAVSALSPGATAQPSSLNPKAVDFTPGAKPTTSTSAKQTITSHDIEQYISYLAKINKKIKEATQNKEDVKVRQLNKEKTNFKKNTNNKIVELVTNKNKACDKVVGKTPTINLSTDQIKYEDYKFTTPSNPVTYTINGNNESYNKMIVDGDGHCLYHSVAYLMLLRNKNEGPTGWKPSLEQSKAAGNLRDVLLKYACRNTKKIIQESNIELKALYETIIRISDDKWGETDEIVLLARLFNVCVCIISSQGEDEKEVYVKEYWSSKGRLISEAAQVEKECKNNNVIHLLSIGNTIKGGCHYDALIPVVLPLPTSTSKPLPPLPTTPSTSKPLPPLLTSTSKPLPPLPTTPSTSKPLPPLPTTPSEDKDDKAAAAKTPTKTTRNDAIIQAASRVEAVVSPYIVDELPEIVVRHILKIYKDDNDPVRQMTGLSELFKKVDSKIDTVITNKSGTQSGGADNNTNELKKNLNEYVYPYYQTLFEEFIPKMKSMIDNYNRYIMNESRYLEIVAELMMKLDEANDYSC